MSTRFIQNTVTRLGTASGRVGCVSGWQRTAESQLRSISVEHHSLGEMIENAGTGPLSSGYGHKQEKNILESRSCTNFSFHYFFKKHFNKLKPNPIGMCEMIGAIPCNFMIRSNTELKNPIIFSEDGIMIPRDELHQKRRKIIPLPSKWMTLKAQQ